MKILLVNGCVLIGFGLIIFGVYQFSAPWALIISGLGIGGCGLLYALAEIIQENKEADK